MKEILTKTKDGWSSFWNKINGKKTYITGSLLVLLSFINWTFPDFMPQDFYDTAKSVLEIAVFGSASHGLYKTLKSK